MVVLEILRLFWSIKRFRGFFLDIFLCGYFGYFDHFKGFWVVLVVLEILRLFWSIKRFRGVFLDIEVLKRGTLRSSCPSDGKLEQFLQEFR